MTSRKERDIERSLEEYIREEDAVCLQRDVVDQDIQRYIQQRLRDKKSLAKWTKDAAISQEVEDALMRGAHGMYVALGADTGGNTDFECARFYRGVWNACWDVSRRG
jgi:type III secretory pathway component EscV